MHTSLILDQVLQPAMHEVRDRTALSFEDQESWTYGELAEVTFRYANGLLRLGCARGDRVGILLRNCNEYWAAYLAITRIGAIAVRLNWRLAPEELAYAVADSDPSVILAHSDLAEGLPAQGQQTYEVVVVPEDPASMPQEPARRSTTDPTFDDASMPPVPRPAPSDPCMLMYTSGTTGRPKGALWTHNNTMWFAAMQAMRWKYDRSTVAMSTGPLFHVGSFEDHLLPALTVGGHAVISKSGGFSIPRALAVMDHHKVTDSLLYSFMLTELVNDPDLQTQQLASLRTVTTGGSPVPPEVVEDFRNRFPHISLEQVYGLTEGGAISTVMPADHVDQHPGSAGKPLSLTEVRIAAEGNPARPSESEEVGEVLVRSPSVCGQYFEKSEATAETFIEGWCRTGDLGKLTADGYLYITGRAKDMIISGGENVYPLEVENVLARIPGVMEAAVIGVADDRFQEAVCAVVVADAGNLDAETVRKTSRQYLAGYKCPRHIVFTNELPRNASGKVLKSQLRQQYANPTSS